MPKTQCCVPRCFSRGGHVFPGEDRPTIRQQWLINIRRDLKKGVPWSPTVSSVVCSSHFKSSDYMTKTRFGTSYTIMTGTESKIKRLTQTAVPSIFAWTKTRKERPFKPRTYPENDPPLQEDSQDEPIPEIGEETEIVSDDLPFLSTSTQTPNYQTQGPTVTTSSTNTVPQPIFTVSKFSQDPAGIHCFTGLENYEKFKLVFDSLGPASYRLTYMFGPVSGNISILDRFFLVLIKLRRHYTNFEISRLFAICESDVYNIFCTWVRFMALQWREIPLWPSRDLVKFYSPTGFQGQFPSTRVIVDGTECPVMKPKFPTAQQCTFSTYKNKNTVKVLIASKRVHVERVIGLAKTFTILTRPLNASETILSSDITFIYFMLCNFRQGIVHRNA